MPRFSHLVEGKPSLLPMTNIYKGLQEHQPTTEIGEIVVKRRHGSEQISSAGRGGHYFTN